MTRRPDYFDGSSNDSTDRWSSVRSAFRRIFSDAEHPLTWSIPACAIAGIRIRVHILFLLYAGGQMLWSINKDFFGPGYTAITIGLLFGIVLLHELGHCLACRRTGGEADEILMWPLGGLASCHPPDTWRAHLITTLGGPAVNVLIAPITAAALWASGKPGTILFNPFEMSSIFFELSSWWLVTLWLLHALNLTILAFNVLLPIFPLDGGRILQAILWRRQGRERSMRSATMVGLIASMGLAVFALVADTTILLGVAGFGALVCWVERQRLSAADSLTDRYDPYEAEQDEKNQARAVRLATQQAERQDADQAELDRILAQIADRGMESLNRRDKRTLLKATKRRQQGG